METNELNVPVVFKGKLIGHGSEDKTNTTIKFVDEEVGPSILYEDEETVMLLSIKSEVDPELIGVWVFLTETDYNKAIEDGGIFYDSGN